MSETSDAGRLVQAYLASKGLQPTAENVSRALQMNAQSPGVIGGLVNQAPDSAASAPTATATTQPQSMMQRVVQQSAPAQPTSAPIPGDRHDEPAPPAQAAPAPPASGLPGNITPQELLTALAGVGAGGMALRSLARTTGGTQPGPRAEAAPPPPAVPMQAGDPLQEALNKAMGPPERPLVDDGISVPAAHEMGLPRQQAPITPSQLLKEKQMMEGTNNVMTPETAPHPAELSNVMRNAQRDPEGVGKVLQMMAKRAAMLRGVRP